MSVRGPVIAYDVCVRIGVVGLWHLGFVYAACLAELGHDVVAYDPDVETINRAQQSEFPVEESGLAKLTAGQVAIGRVCFTDSLEDLNETEIIWVTHDVPVDVNDQADLRPLDSLLSKVIAELSPKQVLVVSSQVPGKARRPWGPTIGATLVSLPTTEGGSHSQQSQPR